MTPFSSLQLISGINEQNLQVAIRKKARNSLSCISYCFIYFGPNSASEAGKRTLLLVDLVPHVQ